MGKEPRHRKASGDAKLPSAGGEESTTNNFILERVSEL
ncbi:hypothetical protein M388_02725 [Mesotoga sp. Brook.08.YT.4.2.5.4.]|nr:hypothetical protein M388_02725 [Mesotoga sp. Brook.08.YT.4.2.5.4.]